MQYGLQDGQVTFILNLILMTCDCSLQKFRDIIISRN